MILKIKILSQKKLRANFNNEFKERVKTNNIFKNDEVNNFE